MPSTDFSPQTEHRDLGLGVTFFKHSYRSHDDKKTYHYHTHLPTLGYCPGCSPKAHLNLKSQSSSDSSKPARSLSATASSVSLTLTDDDLIDYPEDGVLVNAETHHSGPSYTSENELVNDSEATRIKMVKFVLDQWAKQDATKKMKADVKREEMQITKNAPKRVLAQLQQQYADNDGDVSDDGFQVVAERTVSFHDDDDDAIVVNGRKDTVGVATKKLNGGLGLVPFDKDVIIVD